MLASAHEARRWCALPSDQPHIRAAAATAAASAPGHPRAPCTIGTHMHTADSLDSAVRTTTRPQPAWSTTPRALPRDPWDGYGVLSVPSEAGWPQTHGWTPGVVSSRVRSSLPSNTGRPGARHQCTAALLRMKPRRCRGRVAVNSSSPLAQSAGRPLARYPIHAPCPVRGPIVYGTIPVHPR